MATTLAALRDWQPDVMVVVAYGLILPQAVLDLPRMGCLNIHASLLPRWRGAAPIQRAILAGDATTGVSIMQMDAGLDTGDDTARGAAAASVRRWWQANCMTSWRRWARRRCCWRWKAWRQGNWCRDRSRHGVTHAAKLSKDEARVDWNSGAVQIDRQIRAFNPWPVAETRLRGEPVKLLRSRVAPAGAGSGAKTNLASTPGTLLGLADDALEVCCGQGVLQVLQLQRAGRRPVSARDFLNAEAHADPVPLVFE